LKLKYVSAVPQNTSSKSRHSTDEDIFADEDEQTTSSSTDKITRSLASLDVEDEKSDSETTTVKQTTTLKELVDEDEDEDDEEVVEEPKVVVKAKKVVAKPVTVTKTKGAGK